MSIGHLRNFPRRIDRLAVRDAFLSGVKTVAEVEAHNDFCAVFYKGVYGFVVGLVHFQYAAFALDAVPVYGVVVISHSYQFSPKLVMDFPQCAVKFV